MKQWIHIAIWLGALLLFAPPDARAQATGSELVEAVQAAFRALDYEQAEQHARTALAAYDRLSVEQLTEVHVLLALVKFAQDDPAVARQQFEAALQLDPAVGLDPLFVSPKARTFFEDVREAWRQRRTQATEEAPPSVRYVVLDDPRPAAALRSMLVPGWGQLYKQERTKGWVLVGLWSATAAGTGAAHLLRQDARRAYLDERDPAAIAGRYDTYDTWHKVRNNLALGAAAVWVYAYVDALVVRGRLGDDASARLHLSPSPEPTFGVSVRF